MPVQLNTVDLMTEQLRRLNILLLLWNDNLVKSKMNNTSLLKREVSRLPHEMMLRVNTLEYYKYNESIIHPNLVNRLSIPDEGALNAYLMNCDVTAYHLDTLVAKIGQDYLQLNTKNMEYCNVAFRKWRIRSWDIKTFYKDYMDTIPITQEYTAFQFKSHFIDFNDKNTIGMR